MAAGDLSKILALRAEVEALRDRFGPLEDAVGNIAGTIDDLAARQKQAKPAPAWWPTMGEGEHAERWPAFLAWLRDVYAARYPADARRLTACWDLHPPVVDALTALWLTWQAAYLNPSADARDSAQWLTAWRAQLSEVIVRELEDCTAEGALGDRGKHRAETPLLAALLDTLR